MISLKNLGKKSYFKILSHVVVIGIIGTIFIVMGIFTEEEILQWLGIITGASASTLVWLNALYEMRKIGKVLIPVVMESPLGAQNPKR